MVLPIVFPTKEFFCACWSSGVFILKDDDARKTVLVQCDMIGSCLPHLTKILSLFSKFKVTKIIDRTEEDEPRP
jgi:hypothetical protein